MEGYKLYCQFLIFQVGFLLASQWVLGREMSLISVGKSRKTLISEICTIVILFVRI